MKKEVALNADFVSVETLCKGSWFALEQCGRLLRSAAEVFDSGDHATGVALAMLGQEELGRSRILRDMAKRVAAGEAFRPEDIQNACFDHVVKQRAAVLGITLNDPPEPFRSLIKEKLGLTPGTEEYRRANDKLDEVIKAKARRLPQDRHDMRTSALYVDLDDDGTTWNRPSALSRARAYDVISGAVNDYAGQYDPVRIGMIEEEFPPMAAARTAIAAQFELPAPRQPSLAQAAQQTA